MEAVGLLAGGVAHDFNNMLTVINGFSELLQRAMTPDSPQWEMVDQILTSGQRAAELVRQLLAFSRKQMIEPRVLDLNRVVTEMEKMLRRLIGEHIHVMTLLAPDLWPVRVDPAQVQQVIMNLVVNARDAMPRGGTLVIETANLVLDEAYVRDHLDALSGAHVLLTVSDTGMGMSEEVQAHIFEPFFTTKELGKGTGLGLATVYGIVRQSGGHIGVYSEEGRGTAFKVYLPRVRGADEPVSGESHQPAEMTSGRETVLVVEDEITVRTLAAHLLRASGYVVLEAPDGHTAWRLAQAHPGRIHLLLTDVVMPGMSGPDLAQRLKEALPELKVLFMSGYTDGMVSHHGVLEPGMPFISKPFQPGDLARKVREVLDA
jgi:two-component system, cell cycle sensor histidine kinase and response regulator CckA